MPSRWLIGLIIALIAGGGFLACSDDSPVAPDASHTASGGHHMSSDVTTLSVEPFTFRAPMDPFKIHQLPDFMIHSKARKDIVFQSLEFAPGPGPWHTHPGPSFVYVVEGELN